MKKIRLFITLLICAVVSLNLSAQSFKYESVKNDPLNARIYTLGNGLKVYMSVNKSEPRIQTYIAVRVGSKNDPSATTGLAHYFEHMMFKGSEKFGTTNWKKEKEYIEKIEDLYEVYRKEKDPLKRKGLYAEIDSLSYIASGFAIANEYDKMMSFIGSQGTNAATSNDYTFYQEDIPSNQLENWAKIQADRFANPVLRLFHTELETIYEEKNMSLTKDYRKVNEAMLKALFPSHPYGQQTTLGEAEHLRNPSLKNIKEFHSQYYVPNNYCIAMSGDFDPDKAIKIIDKYFGGLKAVEVPKLEFKAEKEITKVKEIEVKGLESEYITIAYRINAGSTSKEAMMAELIDMILNNGYTGLIDKNINQKQLCQRANSGVYGLNDYTAFILRAYPTKGQGLDELKSMLLQQIDILKTGNWDESILQAGINNMKFREIRSLESNSARAMKMAMSYLSNVEWENEVNYLDNLSQITKDEIVAFANQIFKSNNYVVIKKIKDEPETVAKVEKPAITPIQINRSAESDFFKKVKEAKVEDIKPVFVDYDKDMSIKKMPNGTEILYVKNTDNTRYSLSFRYAVGSWENKYLNLLSYYQDFLYTPFMSQQQIKEKLYNIATTFRISVSGDETVVTIEGLTENLLEALDVVDGILTNPCLDKKALESIKQKLFKERAEAKSAQQQCFSKLSSYALYGKKNAHRTLLSDKEINKLTTKQLTEQIKNLKLYEEQITYYGDLNIDAIEDYIFRHHKMNETGSYKKADRKLSEKQKISKNKVYFVNYPANQSYCRMFIVGDKYDESQRAVVAMYNEYFGGSMNSIVFQEMREKRSLAYQASSRYIMGSNKTDKNYNLAHIATQNDKVVEAFDAFNSLLDYMPVAENNFDLAKQSILKSIATNRTTKQAIISSYLTDKEYGRKENTQKKMYEQLQKMTFEDIKAFSEQNLKGQKRVYVILGSKDQINFDEVKKFGDIEELTLEEIFGY